MSGRDPSSNPLDGVWRRAGRLGLIWAALFFAVTLLIYLLLGGLGWSAGVGRALCAMAVGPVLALVGIAAWWMVRRPAFEPPRRKRDDADE